MTDDRTRRILLMAALACAVAAVYGQVATHGFIEYDDPGYVRDNLTVRRGLTWEGVRWAFTTNWLGHWSPLTWISHMLDVQLFGLAPGAHHAVNVALHIVNTLLLFAIWRQMTGDVWPSFVVAALFGLHPLHVESVAWISERKDTLSTLFWFLTMAAYIRFVRFRSPARYGATLLFFTLGLLAKPMLVTLPFVLLLLDWWPLNRLILGSGLRHPKPGPRTRDSGPTTRASIGLLLGEKLPLLALTALFSVVAYTTQSRSGAMAKPAVVSLSERVSNALVAYVEYLAKMLWPANLAILYPFDPYLPAWQVIVAVVMLVAVTGLVLRVAERHPYAPVGWFWYLGTLVPVIGFVQIGSQAFADRYTYVPLVGIFVLLAWCGRALAARWQLPTAAVAGSTAIIIAGYSVATWLQVGLWKDDAMLLAHTVRVTKNNCIARNNLGVTLAARGQIDAAMEQYHEALRIKPDYADAHNNVALTLWRQGKREEALEHYRASLRAAPGNADTHSNIGLLLTELNQNEEGIRELDEALRLDPALPGAHIHMGSALSKTGRHDEAVPHFQRALQLDPTNAAAQNGMGITLGAQEHREEAVAAFRLALQYDSKFVNAWNNLGLVLGQLGRNDEAIPPLAEAVRLEPDKADLRINLGTALRTVGRLPEAIAQYEEALRIEPASIDARYNLAVTLTASGRNQDALAQYDEVLRQKPSHAMAHNDLGVALVNLSRLSDAIRHFEQALELEPGLQDAKINLDIARGMAQDPQ